jgi:membrane-associated phospholipid phosphatase
MLIPGVLGIVCGYARIVRGIHYLSDCVAAFLAGTTCGLFVTVVGFWYMPLGRELLPFLEWGINTP